MNECILNLTPNFELPLPSKTSQVYKVYFTVRTPKVEGDTHVVGIRDYLLLQPTSACIGLKDVSRLM